MIEKQKPNLNFTTPEFRGGYLKLFTAEAFKAGDKPKFSLTMHFSKTTDISVLKQACLTAAIKEWGSKEKGKWPAGFRWPWKDGDKTADKEGNAGHWLIKASSQFRPGVVDRQRAPIAETDNVVYSGCYLRAELSAKAYVMGVDAGITLYLQNIQFMRDGDAFSGRKKAEDVFDDVEDASNNPENYGDADPTSAEMFG